MKTARLGLALFALTALAATPAAAQHRQAASVWPTPWTATLASAVTLAGEAAAGTSHHDIMQESTGRHTKRGLVIGAVAGALGGLGIGTFIYLFCEGENDDCGPVIPVVTVLGAASGAVAGAIIGAAIPRRVEPDTAAPEVSEHEPRERRIGSLSAAFGWAHATMRDGSFAETSGSGPSVWLALMAELLPSFAIGPELGKAWLGDAGNVRHAALAVRGTWPRARISPYVSANLGAYQTATVEFLGGGLGLGARVLPFGGDRVFIDVEARASRHTQNIEPMRMSTLSLGGGVYW